MRFQLSRSNAETWFDKSSFVETGLIDAHHMDHYSRLYPQFEDAARSKHECQDRLENIYRKCSRKCRRLVGQIADLESWKFVLLMEQVSIVRETLVNSILSLERVLWSPLFYRHDVCTARFHQVAAQPLVPEREMFVPPNETAVNDKFYILELMVVFRISESYNRMLEGVKNRLLQNDDPKYIRSAAISDPASHLSIEFSQFLIVVSRTQF